MLAAKLERLDALLDAEDLTSVWFARPNAFAWLTGGDNVVDRESPVGVAAVGYDGSQVRVLTDTIEADRIEAEELPDLPDETPVETYPWYSASLAEALADAVDGPAAADVDVPGLASLDPTPLRQPLTERDRERYRDLGRETAAAVESVCRELRPDDTEDEVAAALSIALRSRGIEAPVVLVGGSKRAGIYRHYTPTQTDLGAYALVSVTAQRYGLHASCTRTVAFDPPEWLESRHRDAARVEATALAATRETAAADGTASDVFAAIQEAYAAVGVDGEWEHHHQGGAAGFAGREWIATPDLETPVVAPMAYAWNPTIQGAKSEDTHLLTEDGDLETLTATGGWPTLEVDAIDTAGTLERPGILGIHHGDG
ncbi:M24 family metallopeptidase [Natronobiforma cellulositropha]|uniref:M24 family metallopeptidase n=1 Tax=Natronobiforma cellulositropha TaxID=1679076 RepID=UPI0021D5AA3A|nr:M24 family metallopeptidase [Natronobiforma cellulositropha]